MNTFACGRYSGFSPSMLRLDMSLPTVRATSRPAASATSPSSGSGTSQPESWRMPTSWPGPRTRPGEALQNSSGRTASYTLACGRYSGFSPSMSRELMSLPIVYPSTRPAGLTSRASSAARVSDSDSTPALLTL